MTRHTWTYRLIPPLLLVVVVGCVWYSIKYRPAEVAVATPQAESAKQVAKTDANSTVRSNVPTPIVSPMVKKLGSQLEFSLQDIPYTRVSKV